MHQNLVGDDRQQLFARILRLTKQAGSKAIVVIEDTSCATATRAPTPELDVTRLFIERVNNHERVNYHLAQSGAEGLMIVAPNGSRDSFV